MAVSGVGTSYNLQYMVGALFNVATNEAPLLGMLGGTTGGRSVSSKQFQWQEVDNVAPSVDVKLEGATQAGSERTRTPKSNVTQIHQESVELTFTQQSVTDQVSGNLVNVLGDQPVQSEAAFQELLKLGKIASDIDYSFFNGVFADDVDVNTARKTRGLFAAASTSDLATETAPYGTTLTACTATASSDLMTKTAHGLQNGDEIELTLITSGAAGLAVGTAYWVTGATANTWQLSATRGGAAIDITTDGTTMTVLKRNPLTKARVNHLLRGMYTAGAKFKNPVIFCGAYQKQRFSDVYGFAPMDRNIGGVNVSTIETDQGSFGVKLVRNVPTDRVLVADLAFLDAAFLDIKPNPETGRPGGHMLRYGVRTAGATDKTDFYCEVGLVHGPGIMHGYIDGLTTDEALV